jgi:outer membrane protein insertion porin family
MQATVARLALLLLLAPAVVRAQVPTAKYSGRTIAAVQVMIEKEPAVEAGLVDLIETRRGEPLSIAAVRESITHLYSLGRFQDIQVEALDGEEGVVLRYVLTPIHSVEEVDFTGRLELPEGLLRSTMSERFGSRPPVSRADEVARVLTTLYQERGYYRAAIKPVATELHDPDRTILTFEIDAGPRARITGIEVEGDPQTPRADLLDRLDIAPGEPYERADLDRRLADYVDRLKSRRYYQAVATHRAQLSPDFTSATLTVTIDAGPIVEVVFKGDLLPENRLRELVPIERERSADEDLLEDSQRRIEEYLRQQGYWKAAVGRTERLTDGRMAVVFTINRGLLYRVAGGIEVSGNRAASAEELKPLLTMSAGDVYIESALAASANAIRLVYLSRGFAWVDVKAGENELNPVKPGEGLVRPAIVVTEGPRAVLGQLAIAGAQQVPESELREFIRARPGSPYYRPEIAADRDALVLAYRNRGFAAATVTPSTFESEDRTRVDVVFDITEGPQTIVDHILIVGNRRTDEQIIRRELRLRPGEPLGFEDWLESRRRLSALGLFRRITIEPLEHGPPTRRDVLVTVEESPATTVGYGGGVEIISARRAVGPDREADDRLEFAPRGFFEIGRRNLGGKNRSISLFTRLSLRPDFEPDATSGRFGFGFSEYRVVGTYREPRISGWNADLALTGAAEQGVRSSFNFARRGVTAELLRRFATRVPIRTAFRYSLSTTRIFDERLDEPERAVIDRRFPQVRLSMFSAAAIRDTRDDVVDPSAGVFLSGEGSVAARSLGGEVGFIKSYLQAHWFRRMTAGRRIVLATRAAVGLADGFPREEVVDGVPVTIEDLPASERFFAGGDTTIRGFPLDTVGAPNTVSPRGFPIGGNAVVILNAELRMPVWRDVGAAVFVDGGNVFQRVTQMDVKEFRSAVGFGVRYRSPIGPVRLDLGFPTERRIVGGSREDPVVLHFSLGHVF